MTLKNETQLPEFPEAISPFKINDFFRHLDNFDQTSFLPFFVGLENYLTSNQMQECMQEMAAQNHTCIITETLNEQEKRLLNEHFQLNVYQIDNDNFELDLDYGIQEFQKKFYMKFVTLKEPNENSEYSKISSLKVRVTLEKGQHVFLSRGQLDNLLHRFKKVYSSFMKLKKFLVSDVCKFFFSVFNFDEFLLIHSSLNQDLVLVEVAKGFDVCWKPCVTNCLTVFGDDNQPIRFLVPRNFDFKVTILEYFKQESFTFIKSQFGNEVVEDDELVAVQLRCHVECFEFLMKAERLKSVED